MIITIVEYGGTEHHINCKSFEFRTNQVEKWIRIDGSKEIHGVATIKAESEVVTNQEKFLDIFGADAWDQVINFDGRAKQFMEFWTSRYKEARG